ncbi:hypothetical protein TELCIR_19384, partial [Teladorsagia circumcincta]
TLGLLLRCSPNCYYLEKNLRRKKLLYMDRSRPKFYSAPMVRYSKYSSGVDLNCGCPKSDVRAKGFGSFLLNKPDLLADIVRQCRSRISDPDFTISLKVRVQYPLDRTVDLCRKKSPKHHQNTLCNEEWFSSFRLAVGIRTESCPPFTAAHDAYERGVMAANGLLYNPAMFAGYEFTPASCVRDF